MVNKFKTIIEEIKKDKGDVNLFVLAKMDDFKDSWSVLLAAPWITTDNTSEIFNYVISILIKVLSEEEQLSIARLGVFPSNSYVVDIFANNVKTNDGDYVRLENVKINGFNIYEAYVYESKIIINTTPTIAI
jgi:hypothetical protein